MDQDAVVSEQTESGKRLIEALAANGFEVRVAFWVKPTEEKRWNLYLASPVVDEQGPKEAYLLMNRVLRTVSDLWIDPFEVRLIGLNDTLAEAASAVTMPKAPDSPLVARNPRPYPGMEQFDGAYNYFPHPAAPAWCGTERETVLHRPAVIYRDIRRS